MDAFPGAGSATKLSSFVIIFLSTEICRVAWSEK